MDLYFLLLVGIVATSYQEVFEKHGRHYSRAMERRLSNPYQKNYDQLLSEIGFEINASGLCLFPAFLLKQKVALEAFFEENGIGCECQKQLSWEYQQGINYNLNLNETKIPRLQHYVWITHPKKPRELYSIKEQISIVEQSMQTLRNLPGWKQYLWTNDKSLLPETIKWAEGLGLIVREVQELDTFKDFEDLFDLMVDDNVVMASDLIRFMILNELGGMYLDIDQIMVEFDERLLSFDFVSYTTDDFSFGLYIAETSFIASAPQSPLINEYFKQVRQYYLDLYNNQSTSFMAQSECFKKSFYRNMAATGPYRFTAAYNTALLNKDLEGYNVLFLGQPIAMRGKCSSKEEKVGQCETLKDMIINGEKTTLNITTKHFASEMWMDWEEDARKLANLKKN